MEKLGEVFMKIRIGLMLCLVVYDSWILGKLVGFLGTGH